MSTIIPYTMHQTGHIPGIDGYFAAGQTVFVDVDALKVVCIEQAGGVAAEDAPAGEADGIQEQDTTDQQQIVSPATADLNGG